MEHQPIKEGQAKSLGRLVVLAGVLNVVARVQADEFNISVYYAVAPLVAVFLFVSSRGFRIRLVYFSLIMLWGWFAGYLFGTAQSVMVIQTVFLLLCFIAIEAIINWSVGSPTFYRDSERLFDCVTSFILLVFVAQTIFDFDVPGSAEYRQYDISTSIFFTPNDLALYLSTYLVFAVFSNKNLLLRFLIFFCIFYVNFLNDANLAIAANTIVGMVAVLSWVVRKVRYPTVVVIVPMVILGPLGLIAILGASNSGGGVDRILLVVQQILNLERFHLAGSIFDRADALIIGMTEFAATNFLGFGPGGTTAVLKKEENFLVSAQTIHNALAELAFDFGPAFIVPFVLAVGGSIFRIARYPRPSKDQYALLSLILSLVPMAMIQSGGFISNYGFWMCATVIWIRSRRLTDLDVAKMRKEVRKS